MYGEFMKETSSSFYGIIETTGSILIYELLVHLWTSGPFSTCIFYTYTLVQKFKQVAKYSILE